jgi:hypothetical protein
MWLTKLKTALILEDIETLSTLLEETPVFETLIEIEEASFLLMQTKTLIEQKQNQTSQILHHLKNSLNFLKSTQTTPTSTLNLKF